MKHSRDYIVRNDSLKGIRRVLGFCIRNLPFSQVLGFLPSRDPLMPVSCGRTKATLPLSIIQRIVAETPADAFYRSKDKVHMDASALINVLEKIEGEPLPLRTRYAIIDALCVCWASSVFTFAGDVVLQADAKAIQMANERGAENGYARANLSMSIAREAARISGRRFTAAI